MATTTAAAPSSKKRLGDRIFESLSLSAASAILVILAGVAIFLSLKAAPGLTASHETAPKIPEGENFLTFVWPWVFATLWVSLIAVIITVPISWGLALFITQYAPKRIATTVGYVIDLLAAVPSVVFGLWGMQYFAGVMVGPYAWLSDNMGWFPLFSVVDATPADPGNPVSTTGRTIMTAAIVLAVMILPIITAICREVFTQTPRLHKEAALALGATKWEMIKMTVFPYGRSGMISAVMLGLGRALGETMAVTMVLSTASITTFSVIRQSNPTPIPAGIAQGYKETSGLNINVLIGAGLALFIITLIVNLMARAIVNRRKEFSGAN